MRKCKECQTVVPYEDFNRGTGNCKECDGIIEVFHAIKHPDGHRVGLVGIGDIVAGNDTHQLCCDNQGTYIVVKK